MLAREHSSFAGTVLEINAPPPYWERRWHATFLVEIVSGDLRPGMALLVAESGRRYPVRIDGTVRVDAIQDERSKRILFSNAKHAGSRSDDILYVAAYCLQETLRPDLLRLTQAAIIGSSDDMTSRAPASLVELRALATQSATIREAAVQALSMLEQDAPVELLVIELDDEVSDPAWVAAHALGKLGSRAPLSPFLERYRNPNVWNQALQRAAVDVFAAHPEDPRAVTALTELLYGSNRRSDGVTNAAALQALGRLGPQAPVGLLIEELASNPVSGVRNAAAQALKGLEGKRVDTALTRALDDSDVFVREAAAYAILGRDHLAALPVYEQAQTILRLKQGRDEALYVGEQEQMREFDRTITPDTQDGWLAALTHAEWETRVSALKRLASLGPDVPLEPFIAALSDPDGSVQMHAADILGELAGITPMDERVVDELFSQISRTRDDPQAYACTAIVNLAPWLPRETLIAHLGDASWRARNAALEALISLGVDTPVEPLIAAAGDVSDYIRGEALRALHARFPEAFGRIAREAEAVLAGGEIGPTFDGLVQCALINQIRCWQVTSPEAIAQLRTLLEHPYWVVRCWAMEALDELETPRSEETMRRLMALRDDPGSSAVREAAQELLEKPGGEAE